MSVGSRLEEARTKRGLSLKEMAAQLKVPRYRLEPVEKGHLRELQPELLLRYVDRLGLNNWFGKWKKADTEFAQRMGLSSHDLQQVAGKKTLFSALLKTLVEKKLDAFLRKRVPPQVVDKIRLAYTFRGNSVTIYEHRASGSKEYPEWSTSAVAQHRYNTRNGTWMLYWRDRNNRWHKDEGLATVKNLDMVLDELDRDPTGIYWG